MYRNNPAESSHQVSKGNAIFNPNFCKDETEAQKDEAICLKAEP